MEVVGLGIRLARDRCPTSRSWAGTDQAGARMHGHFRRAREPRVAFPRIIARGFMDDRKGDAAGLSECRY